MGLGLLLTVPGTGFCSGLIFRVLSVEDLGFARTHAKQPAEPLNLALNKPLTLIPTRAILAQGSSLARAPRSGSLVTLVWGRLSDAPYIATGPARELSQGLDSGVRREAGGRARLEPVGAHLCDRQGYWSMAMPKDGFQLGALPGALT